MTLTDYQADTQSDIQTELPGYVKDNPPTHGDYPQAIYVKTVINKAGAEIDIYRSASHEDPIVRLEGDYLGADGKTYIISTRPTLKVNESGDLATGFDYDIHYDSPHYYWPIGKLYKTAGPFPTREEAAQAGHEAMLYRVLELAQ